MAHLSRPLTSEEVFSDDALYLINDQYQGIIIVNNGNTISCWIMDGISTQEATESVHGFIYPSLACLTSDAFFPANEFDEITFDAPVGKWGPHFLGPLNVTPQRVNYPSYQTVEIDGSPQGSAYACLARMDGRLVLCGLGRINLYWDSNYPDYTPIIRHTDGSWYIGENMADVRVNAQKVKDYIAEHGYELWPDGEYLNSQLLTFVDGKIVITLWGPPDGPEYTSRSFSCPAFPTV